MSKSIEVCELSIKDLAYNFGNPRNIKKNKLIELTESLKEHGDFGVIVIDEHNNVIAGNQRVKALMKLDPETKVLCKRLIGYSKTELRAINIKANLHSGDWDMELLAEWTADLNINIDLKPSVLDHENALAKNMELMRFEKYDYVIIACRSDVDFGLLCQKLEITNKEVTMHAKRKIKARAVWFDKVVNVFK